jgi:uncharacterized protein
MGKAEKAIKVVLDTNVLISGLIFTGRANRIVDLWKKGSVIPVLSRETFLEFRTALSYPKFALSKEEIQTIIEKEVLPYFKVVEISDPVSGVYRDPDDDKFLSCAVSASAEFIVSGDEDLLAIKEYRSVKVLGVAEFLATRSL